MTAGVHLRLKRFGLAVTACSSALGGVVLLTAPPADGDELATFVESWAPLHLLGWVWIAAAALGVAGCVVRGLQPAAFAASSALHVAWGFSYLASWVVFDEPRGWVTAAVYLVIAALVLVVAGIREGSDGWATTGRR